MAYCIKCGAYIPDGQTACLACGYDPAAEQKNAETTRSGSAAAQAARQNRTTDSNEEMRRRLEEQRKRTQEQNRRWAEQEKERRDEQAAREEARRRQQEADRRWAQQEYERRRAEQRAQESSRPDYFEDAGGTATEGNRALAALSYLSVLFAIPYVFTPNDYYAKFHAKQGLKLFIFGILCDAVGALTGLGWILTLLRLYLIYKGMMNALNGKWEPLPWIGKLGDG